MALLEIAHGIPLSRMSLRTSARPATDTYFRRPRLTRRAMTQGGRPTCLSSGDTNCGNTRTCNHDAVTQVLVQHMAAICKALHCCLLSLNIQPASWLSMYSFLSLYMSLHFVSLSLCVVFLLYLPLCSYLAIFSCMYSTVLLVISFVICLSLCFHISTQLFISIYLYRRFYLCCSCLCIYRHHPNVQGDWRSHSSVQCKL